MAMALVQRKDDSRQAFRRSHDAFVAAISHEVRTPLAVVSGLARTLAAKRSELSPEQIDGLLERLLVNAERLDALLLDVLDVDRLARGIVDVRRRPVDLRDLVEGVVARTDCGGRRVNVKIAAERADVDRDQIERVVETLLVNAANHTPPGTPIHIHVYAAGPSVLIDVSDEGPGVPPELREEIFCAFVRGGTPCQSPGVGIGLSVVRSFVQLHGGRVWVDDRPGGGAAFHVLLPNARC